MPSLKEKYQQEIVPSLMEELGIKNRMALPKIQKVILNVGIGASKINPKVAESARETLKSITGQAPAIRRARKAISGFKIREGEEVGLTVTLRGAKMYEFAEKLANVTLPRLRDFRGLDPESFDQAGNLSLGFKEQIIFPEITTQKAEVIHGLEVTFVINSHSAKHSQKLLEKLGFPFKKSLEGSNPSASLRAKEKNG